VWCGLGQAIAVGTQLWLLANGAGASIGSASVTLIPWGVTLLVAWLVARTAGYAAKLGTASEEADESVDWLEYLRDGRIKHDPALLQEATELAKIMAKAYRTSKRNNEGYFELLTCPSWSIASSTSARRFSTYAMARSCLADSRALAAGVAAFAMASSKSVRRTESARS